MITCIALSSSINIRFDIKILSDMSISWRLSGFIFLFLDHFAQTLCYLLLESSSLGFLLWETIFWTLRNVNVIASIRTQKNPESLLW